MLKVFSSLAKQCIPNKTSSYVIFNIRTFLSPAYYCSEVWERRLGNPILQGINLDELYYNLDQRFQKTRHISAVDVDVFVNSAVDNSYIDENLDLVHKLRLSADTGNTLSSTSHALIRMLIQSENKDDLLNALDDRLNYGLFLDYYTANILLDTFWKKKDFTSGARVASQLMLQEEFKHPLSNFLSLLHCYNYLLRPEGWPEYSKPEEPEEEVKIRVKYIRNAYDDDHFDLRDPKKIVGKTLAMFTKGKNDQLSKSFNILGLALYGKQNLVSKTINECSTNDIVLYKEIIDLVPPETEDLQKLKTETANLQDILLENVNKAIQETSESDIAQQCETYLKWEADRINALEEQKKRLDIAKRLSNIEDIKAALKEKETKLWFFDNEEKIELAIEAKTVCHPKQWSGKKKKPKKIDEGYIPPEISRSNTKN